MVKYGHRKSMFSSRCWTRWRTGVEERHWEQQHLRRLKEGKGALQRAQSGRVSIRDGLVAWLAGLIEPVLRRALEQEEHQYTCVCVWGGGRTGYGGVKRSVRRGGRQNSIFYWTAWSEILTHVLVTILDDRQDKNIHNALGRITAHLILPILRKRPVIQPTEMCMIPQLDITTVYNSTSSH